MDFPVPDYLSDMIDNLLEKKFNSKMIAVHLTPFPSLFYCLTNFGEVIEIKIDHKKKIFINVIKGVHPHNYSWNYRKNDNYLFYKKRENKWIKTIILIQKTFRF